MGILGAVVFFKIFTSQFHPRLSLFCSTPLVFCCFFVEYSTNQVLLIQNTFLLMKINFFYLLIKNFIIFYYFIENSKAEYVLYLDDSGRFVQKHFLLFWDRLLYFELE